MVSLAVGMTCSMDCIGVDAYTPPVTFAKRVQLFLKRRGWTQAELMRRSGLDRQTVHRIVKGKIGYGAKSSIRIAKAFGIPVAALDPDSPSPEEADAALGVSPSDGLSQLSDAQLVNAMAALVLELEYRKGGPPPHQPPPPPNAAQPPTRRRKRR